VLENAKDVIIESCVINGGADYGLFAIDVNNLQVANCKFNGLGQKPICIVGESQYFKIDSNDFGGNFAGGIYVSGNIGYGIIENNNIHDNYGTSNWMAGIVLTNVESTEPMNIWETFDEAHHFPQKEDLYSQVKAPHNILIENNEVCDNNASGIYSDGAYNCFVVNNDVIRNDKEGICLDYGTIGFYLCHNLFDGNGCRARQTDEDLSMDFVLDAGRMDDGSAKSKLPGVSLDNTAYNILENNIVINNYGGGIKMVRTTIRTLIYENIIKDNNKGQNDSFHFFGIELGSAIADVEASDMDFTPDYENIICRNTISGNHYSGIFVGDEGYVNDIFDNVIMESQMFAIEDISLRFNSIVNNVSDADNRIEFQN
jgi:parallel beta-helix repeat protein